jgi:hypothetical protein
MKEEINKLNKILNKITENKLKSEDLELKRLKDHNDDNLFAGMRLIIDQLGFEPAVGCVIRNTALGPLEVRNAKIEGEYFKVECVLKNDSLLTHSGIQAIRGHKMGYWDIKFSRKKFNDKDILKRIRSMFNDVISGTNSGEKPF